MYYAMSSLWKLQGHGSDIADSIAKELGFINKMINYKKSEVM